MRKRGPVCTHKSDKFDMCGPEEERRDRRCVCAKLKSPTAQFLPDRWKKKKGPLALKKKKKKQGTKTENR